MGLTLGKVAYEAYYKASNGRSLVSGQQLPTWERQLPEIQEAWESAGAAVAAEVVDKE
jgi:hypothetical protein